MAFGCVALPLQLSYITALHNGTLSKAQAALIRTHPLEPDSPSKFSYTDIEIYPLPSAKVPEASA